MLTAIIATPLLTALVVFFSPKEDTAKLGRIAKAGTILPFLLSLVLLACFDMGEPGMQFVDSFPWIPMFNINYQVGVDGISLWLVLLTTFLSVIAVCFSLDQKDNLKAFLVLMLALETGILGVFVALDTILFYVFWELMLVPTYFLIGLWGEGQRVYATTKFVVYTVVGSLLMLVAIVGLTVIHYKATETMSFDIRVLLHTHIDPDTQIWMFAFFFLAFAIKVPIFPLHSWLPHAYMACPIPTLILLTGAMSKAGAYGLVRFCLPLFPHAVEKMGLAIGGLAAVGIVYGAWIAIAQRDIKGLVAWSSVSHLGFIALGIFANNSQGLNGSVLQMVNHGIIASALFVIVGIVEQRMQTRNLDDLRGLKSAMPALYGMFLLITLSALGLPGLNGFVGEFLILLGVWTSVLLSSYSVIYVLMGGLSIVFASIYMLYMFQGAMQEKNEKIPATTEDINCREKGMLFPACVLAVLIGLFPKPFIDRISPAIDHMLAIEKTVNLPAGNKEGHH